jgi:hypothetical protein
MNRTCNPRSAVHNQHRQGPDSVMEPRTRQWDVDGVALAFTAAHLLHLA